MGSVDLNEFLNKQKSWSVPVPGTVKRLKLEKSIGDEITPLEVEMLLNSAMLLLDYAISKRAWNAPEDVVTDDFLLGTRLLELYSTALELLETEETNEAVEDEETIETVEKDTTISEAGNSDLINP